MTEKINEISMVFPCDILRVPLFLNTLAKYQQFGIPPNVEIIVVSRTFSEIVIPGINIKVVSYKYEGEHFCPSLAFNLGVKKAKYKNIIIGHPEVRPINHVLEMLMASERGNYVCKVFDLNSVGDRFQVLFGSVFRDEWPGLYFLACYKKEDIEAINGWDMRFMDGYSNEDIDFGQRMENAGFSYSIRDDIMGDHQYHKRGNCSEENDGWKKNRKLFEDNKANKVTWVENGINEVEI